MSWSDIDWSYVPSTWTKADIRDRMTSHTRSKDTPFAPVGKSSQHPAALSIQ